MRLWTGNRASLIVAEALILAGLDEGYLRERNSSLGLGIVESKSIRRNLVDVREGWKIISMVAVVGKTQANALSQIPFQCEVPFLDNGILVVNVGRQVVELCAGLRSVGRDRNREFGIYGFPLSPNELKKYPMLLDSTDHPLIAVALCSASMNLPYPPRMTVLLLPPRR